MAEQETMAVNDPGGEEKLSEEDLKLFSNLVLVHTFVGSVLHESSFIVQEAINTVFCPSQGKFHTFVLRGVRNISDTP